MSCNEQITIRKVAHTHTVKDITDFDSAVNAFLVDYLPLSGGQMTGDLSAINILLEDQTLNRNTLNLYNSNYNTVNSLSAIWNTGSGGGSGGDFNVNNFVYNTSSTIIDVNSVVQTNSGLWMTVNNAQSANNDSVYNTVNSFSANWNYQGTDIKSLTSNWQETFTNFSVQSANNDSVYTNVDNFSANWQETFTNFSIQSANNLSDYSTVNSYSATWLNYQNLSSLKDVYITSPVDGQSLLYNNILKKWVAGNGVSAMSGIGYYGSFYDLTPIQICTNPTSAYKLKLGNTYESNGVYLSGDNVVFQYTGVYELELSVQIINNDNAPQDVDLWFRKNNVDLPNSNSVFSARSKIGNTGGKLIANVPYLGSFIAGDQLSIYWNSQNTNVSIQTISAQTSPIIPTSPATIFCVSYNSAAVGIASTAYNTVNSYSANWNSVYSTVKTKSANDLSNYTTVNSNSSNWNSVYSTVNAQSANNVSNYTTVNSYSANWNYQGTDVKSLTSNWQNTYTNFSIQSANNLNNYTTVNSFSANWNYQGTDVKSLTSNWQETFNVVKTKSANDLSNYTTVNSNSSNWNSVYSTVNTQSANNVSNYTTVNSYSANWNYQGTDIKSLTSNWQETFNTVNTYSAVWTTGGPSGIDSGVRALTGNWDSVYTTVNSNSALWNTAGMDIAVRSLTGNWQSTFNTVNSNSAINANIATVVQTNSALWAIDNTADNTVRELTGNWQSTFSTVNTQSGNNLSNYSTVNTNSALWMKGSDLYNTVWIGAGAMIPVPLSGANAVTMPITATGNNIFIDSMQFDASTNQYSQFALTLPSNANKNNIKAKFSWSTVVNAATGDCVWGIQGKSVSDSSSIDTGWGPAIEITDSITGNTYLQVSSATAFITLSGTIADDSLLLFRIYRNAASLGDTLAVSSALYGVNLQYSINNSLSAQW